MTATPAVVDDTVYVGDWSGTLLRPRPGDGEARWTYDTEIHDKVYAGQIVSSAAVADVDGVRTVFFAGGKTLYALRPPTASWCWRHELGRRGRRQRPHRDRDVARRRRRPGRLRVRRAQQREGRARRRARARRRHRRALDDCDRSDRRRRRDRARVRRRVGLADRSTSSGEARLRRHRATAPSSPDGWGRYTEAIVRARPRHGRAALDVPAARAQQRRLRLRRRAEPVRRRTAGPLVGLGNKDAAYYAVDRETGEVVWRHAGHRARHPAPGSNYSTGGFIGPTAVADGVVVGGTAVGGDPVPARASTPPPARSAGSSRRPAGTYAAAGEANGVVFLGGTDFTLRALDLQTGEVLWSQEMTRRVAGGAVVVGDDVIAVAGIREPGIERPEPHQRRLPLFSLDAARPSRRRPRRPRRRRPRRRPRRTRRRRRRRAWRAPCPFTFDLIEPTARASTPGSGTLEVTARPVHGRRSGRGPRRPPNGVAAARQPGGHRRRRRLRASPVRTRLTTRRAGCCACSTRMLTCTADASPARRGATYTGSRILAVEDSRTGLPQLDRGLRPPGDDPGVRHRRSQPVAP